MEQKNFRSYRHGSRWHLVPRQLKAFWRARVRGDRHAHAHFCSRAGLLPQRQRGKRIGIYNMLFNPSVERDRHILPKHSICRTLTALGCAVILLSCSRPDNRHLSDILNISELPPATSILRCGPVTRDGIQMWDCIVKTNQTDLDKMMSGHQFKDLQMPPPKHAYLALPSNFRQADHIHIVYNEDSGIAAIATHAQ